MMKTFVQLRPWIHAIGGGALKDFSIGGLGRWASW